MGCTLSIPKPPPTLITTSPTEYSPSSPSSSLCEQLRQANKNVASSKQLHRFDTILNKNIKLSMNICLWCLRFYVLKMKSAAVRKWHVVISKMSAATAQDISGTDKEDVSPDEAHSPKKSVRIAKTGAFYYDLST